MRAEKCWASGRESVFVFVFVFVFGRGQGERGRLAIRVRESAGPLTPAAPRSRRPLPLSNTNTLSRPLAQHFFGAGFPDRPRPTAFSPREDFEG
jgi:hypothetical protein